MTDESALVTVLGSRPVPPSGVVDAHGHLWIDPVANALDRAAPVLADEEGITRELAAFRDAGGVAVVDCQPPGCGRNLARLRSLSSATEVDVVACTGFHLPRYYAPDAWPWSATDEAVADRFVEELLHGVEVDGLVARVGAIKTAFTGATDDAQVGRMLACACRASVCTGAAMLVHTERGAGVEQLAGLLVEHGVRPDRVVLCHVDKRPDPVLHRELAAAGFLLEYDTFLRPRYEPERNVWPLLARMLEDGYASALACGLDLADASLWRFGGALVGMVGLPTVVRPRLLNLGASERDIGRLLRGNVVERLRVRTRAEVAAA